MKILVTGGAGYIGSHTTLELLKAGHDAVVVDNLCNSSEESLKRVAELAGRAPKFFQLDIRDEAALDQVVAAEGPFDATIHFAALKAVGESTQIPLKYYENNLGGTFTLLKVLSAHDCKNIVFSSSATVYGQPQSVPIREDFPTPGCTNPYGWTKLMMEQVFRDVQKADPRWNVILLRYFNPIGAHESGRIGEDPAGIPNNLLPYVAQVAVGRLKELSVFGNDYPRPTAPASATTSTWWTSRSDTFARSRSWPRSPASRCTTSEPETATACCRSSGRSRPRAGARCRT